MREWRRDGAENDRRDDGKEGKEGARGGCNTAAYRTKARGTARRGGRDGCNTAAYRTMAKRRLTVDLGDGKGRNIDDPPKRKGQRAPIHL